MADKPNKLSDAEWTVMNALWEHSPASARDVHARMHDRDWAYTTVKTMLDRLVEKGAVAVEKQANAGIFTPLLTRDEARSSAVRSLVERAFGGTFDALVQHFVAAERLTARERAQLKALIDSAPKPGGTP